MAKFVVEVMKTLVAQVEVDAESADEALAAARAMNADGVLGFFDPGIEDEFCVVE
jgi:hypothetical protein